jgi:hypothetical protein
MSRTVMLTARVPGDFGLLGVCAGPDPLVGKRWGDAGG